jgi:hypothetical protein
MLNLFSELPQYKMPLPLISYSLDSCNVRPNMLFVGDSYFACMASAVRQSYLFSGAGYWLYTQRYSSDRKKKVDLRHEIEKRDVVCLIATDGTLAPFPNNFIDQAYEVYAPRDKNYRALKDKEFRFFIRNAMEGIRSNKSWRKQLVRSAKKKKVSLLDEYISVAVWCYNEYANTYMKDIE